MSTGDVDARVHTLAATNRERQSGQCYVRPFLFPGKLRYSFLHVAEKTPEPVWARRSGENLHTSPPGIESGPSSPQPSDYVIQTYTHAHVRVNKVSLKAVKRYISYHAQRSRFGCVVKLLQLTLSMIGIPSLFSPAKSLWLVHEIRSTLIKMRYWYSLLFSVYLLFNRSTFFFSTLKERMLFSSVLHITYVSSTTYQCVRLYIQALSSE